MTLEVSMPWYSLRILLFDVFSADSLLLISPVPLEKKQFLESISVFKQRTKQRQLNAQLNNDSV